MFKMEGGGEGHINEGIQSQVARARLHCFSLVFQSEKKVRNTSKNIYICARRAMQRANEKYPILCRTAETLTKDSVHNFVLI